MDLNDAIDAHVHWRFQFRQFLEGAPGALSGEIAGQEDQCVLGKWLLGEGREKYGNLPEFPDLRAQHARFHAFARAIVERLQAGDKLGVEKLLAVDGDFARASVEIAHQMQRIKRRDES